VRALGLTGSGCEPFLFLFQHLRFSVLAWWATSGVIIWHVKWGHWVL
jgi:hypothetical protein